VLRIARLVVLASLALVLMAQSSAAGALAAEREALKERIKEHNQQHAARSHQRNNAVRHRPERRGHPAHHDGVGTRQPDHRDRRHLDPQRQHGDPSGHHPG
jgi:hypothetical protein